MESVVPWVRLIAVIEPYYPKSGRRGRLPIGLAQKTRDKGLKKNDAQLNVLFALSNLYMVRGKLDKYFQSREKMTVRMTELRPAINP
jgi:hypothetical protein